MMRFRLLEFHRRPWQRPIAGRKPTPTPPRRRWCAAFYGI